MRWLGRLLPTLALLLLALAPAAAQAQFANRSVSLSLGYMDLDETAGLSRGLPLGLAYTGYIDAGFEWTVGLMGMILTEPITERQVIGVAGGPGLRYLFLEETLRPYAGAELTYLHVFGALVSSNYVGIGPYAGVDYFVLDSLSVGVRGQFNLYVMLNQPLQTSKAVLLVASAWF